MKGFESYLRDRINRSCLPRDLLKRICKNPSDGDFLLEEEVRSYIQRKVGEVGIQCFEGHGEGLK